MSPTSAPPSQRPDPAGTTSARPTYAASVAELASRQKSAKGAPAYSRYVNRPLGRRLAALAHVAGRTPNQVTATSGVCTGLGVLTLAVAPVQWWTGLLAAALLVLGYALDAADGQLARLRGGGSKSGEWLDHVVDAAKTPSLHLAVAVGLYRQLESAASPGAWFLLVPLGFAVVASTWFFTIILNDHLRRLAGTRDGQAVVAAGEARQHSRLRSVASMPVDYGVLCVVVALWGWSEGFPWVYGLLFAGNALVSAASMVKWYRDTAALDAPA
ncbi:MAG: CDP-alcohol phosphatidyltransferase family protein [Quadrisphaera sp.]